MSNSTTKNMIITTLMIPTCLYIYLLFITTSSNSIYHSLYTSTSLITNSNSTISHHLYTLTRRPHVAGTQANADAASYVLSTFTSYSLPSRITSYYVSLTYPISRSLTLTQSQSDPPTSITFDLTQKIYSGDPFATNEVLPTFHAYAKSGTAVGKVVYVNYGRVEDYDTLKQMGVNVSGTVALARYGEIFRGDIVRNAHLAGAVGVVVYTDKKDYGGGGGENKGYPDDRWMPSSGVQVGTLYSGAGDPTTPGWASKSSSECERLSNEEVEQSGDVPLIPSLPISWADGEFILRSIGGQVANDDWQGSPDSSVYRVGPGPGFLNLTYSGSQLINEIQNVIAVIEGAVEPDRFVILGNHRDAWTFGAVDPNSGTAALLEVARRFGKLKRKGWRPRRTIILCNWDAEEYGLIGSTEWVEENREMLASRAVAYLNVDCGVSGPGFHASATPQLDELLKQATQQVRDPDNSSQTLYESWITSSELPLIGRLGGGGSDYAPFVQHIGIPSVDILFGGGYPVYHSMYDDFVWMKKFGDPMFHRHVAAASIWGLVALQLADKEFLPFNYLSYADELQTSTKVLHDEVLHKGIDFTPIYKSIRNLKIAANEINNQIKALEETRGWEFLRNKDSLKVRELNDRLMMAERAFTDRDGLRGRPWYKHLVYAPSKHDDYGSKSFPGIDDAIEVAKSLNTREAWQVVQHEVWRVSRAITHASLVLNGGLT
ncbi:N-acetylated-alpha-linked acidic dipeptidase [Thalictrum thalictroides]|uniref:N-acetylated-alpha-linked acidic dipeptidase n=1 Tax=Thalictrum thalictroides TaxID=46969 RepID=A0A7J6WYF3_THATH|nr:N-acetylated-alpha-linked acidic dipeptidase [Thalictrum thalictroides]